jgi:leucyl/phenylalanyl-tRNA--protein transferase
MFTTITDGSKMALANLVSVCLQEGVHAIDCQQNTRHLASLGAREMPRSAFISGVQQALGGQAIHWKSQTLNWPALQSLEGVQ